MFAGMISKNRDMKTQSAVSPGRIASIDIFRALTMLLMIFVNDLWSLSNIPGWLGHTPTHFDGMGLADVVFPSFLFIVGLSIPHALKARQRKGDSRRRIAGHILSRSLALIVMGFLLVNQEHINRELTPLNTRVWQILLIAGFFLIWNVYPRSLGGGKFSSRWLQGAGIILLIVLAAIFTGGDTANPVWLKPYWWGILGLIGWSYLVSAFVYLFSEGRLIGIVAVWLLFNVLNLLEFLPLPENFPVIKLLISASNYALVMSGVLASAIYDRISQEKNRHSWIPGLLFTLSVILVVYGFAVRPFGGISKNLATPSWTAICAGISYAVFALLIIIADNFRLTKWAVLIAPAGRSTLTCYLIPYLIYPVIALAGWHLPALLTTGVVGLIKSLLFALLVVQITGLLEKIGVKLRI